MNSTWCFQANYYSRLYIYGLSFILGSYFFKLVMEFPLEKKTLTYLYGLKKHFIFGLVEKPQQLRQKIQEKEIILLHLFMKNATRVL